MYVCMYVLLYVRTLRSSSRTYVKRKSAPPVGTRAGPTERAEGMTVCEPRQWHTVIP